VAYIVVDEGFVHLVDDAYGG